MSDHDAKAIEQAYARWRLPLLKYLKSKLRNDADAEDLAQESFLRLSRAKGDATAEQPQFFLFHVALNLVKDNWRRKAVRDTVMLSMDDMPERTQDAGMAGHGNLAQDAGCPMEQAAARQTLQRLQQALDELPPRQQEVFVLSRIEGLTQAEIAERLGISRQMVVRHLAKAVAYCELRTEYAPFDCEP